MGELAVAATSAFAAMSWSTVLTDVAISVGLGLVQRALTPNQTINQVGARLQDAQITSAAEGAAIDRCVGTMRLGGQIIWASRFRETVVTNSTSSGGKGGGKVTTETTEYLYSVSIAVAICEATGDVTLNRLWMDGNEAKLADLTYRFHSGSQTMPDSKIVSVEGGGAAVPAFKGVAYVVFEDLPLRDYGNRIPQMSFEITRTIAGDQTVADVLVAEATRIGFTSDKVDVSSIGDLAFSGMAVVANSSPREVIDNIVATHLLDHYEEGDTLVFRPRSSPPTITVDPDDLVDAGTETFVKRRRPDTDLPKRTRVSFIDPARNYGTATVDGQIVTGSSQSVADFTSVCAMTVPQAQFLADTMTYQEWVARDTISFALPMSTPNNDAVYADTVLGSAFLFQGRRYRIGRMVFGDRIEIDAIGYDASVYGAVDYDDSSGIVTGPLELTSTQMIFAEVPLLSEDDLSPWSPRVAVWQEPFPQQVVIYREDGSGGYNVNTMIAVPTIMGVTSSALAAGRVWQWDVANTVTVVLDNTTSQLLSASDLSVLNGANTIAVETPSGEWEVLQFCSAELLAPRTYRLSRLLRGQLGTESFMAASVPAGARFFVYDRSRVTALGGTGDNLGVTMNLRVGPGELLLADDRFTDVAVTPRGVAYRPYAPVHLRQQKLADESIQFSWVRRARLGGDTWESAEVPLSEEFERYVVSIYNGAALVREITVDGTTASNYTKAQQNLDFGVSHGVATVTWTVAQVNAVYGRGATANG